LPLGENEAFFVRRRITCRKAQLGTLAAIQEIWMKFSSASFSLACLRQIERIPAYDQHGTAHQASMT
jgi:hypothetical protein